MQPEIQNNLNLYHLAHREMRDYLRQRTDVVCCWEYGRMTNPGVSDLDLIVVAKDQAEAGLADYLSNGALPKSVVDCMAHANLIVVNESAQEGVFYWDDIRVRNILTEEEEYHSLTPVAPALRQVAMVIDWIFERLYRVAAYSTFGTKDARKTLGDLKSFFFCIDNFIEIGGTLSGHEEMRGRLNGIRDDWIAMKDFVKKKELEILVTKLFGFLPVLYEAVFDFFDRHTFFQGPRFLEGEVTLTFPGGMRWIFADDFSVSKLNENKPVVLVPRCLLGHFSVYCRPESALSRAYAGSFSRDVKSIFSVSDPSYRNFLEARIRYGNDWYDFLVKNQFWYGLYKFGWFLPKAPTDAFVKW